MSVDRAPNPDTCLNAAMEHDITVTRIWHIPSMCAIGTVADCEEIVHAIEQSGVTLDDDQLDRMLGLNEDTDMALSRVYPYYKAGGKDWIIEANTPSMFNRNGRILFSWAVLDIGCFAGDTFVEAYDLAVEWAKGSRDRAEVQS